MPTASGHHTKAEASPHLCQWFYACTNRATRLVAHPAFPSGVPTCEAHG